MVTDPLSLIFLACFLFGLLFLIIAGLMGNLGHGHTIGHAPHVHTGPATSHGHVTPHVVKGPGITTHDFSLFTYINPISIVLFLLGFGFFGYVLHNTTSLVLPLALILAALCACILAALVLSFIARIFGDSEGATVQDVSDRTGLLGRVSITIQENGLGEVLYVSPGGMRKSIPARSSDGQRIERGQEVVVVNYQNGIAEIDTWDSFVGKAEAATAQASSTSPDTSNVSQTDQLTKLRALLEETQGTLSELVIQKDIQKE